MLCRVHSYWAAVIVVGLYVLFLQADTAHSLTNKVLEPLDSYLSDADPVVDYPAPSKLLTQEDSVSINLDEQKPLINQPAKTLSDEPSKMIVLAHVMSENISWAIDEVPGWESALYSVDNKSNPYHLSPDRTTMHNFLSAPRNKGREAGVYLHHIVTHYEMLSDITVFLHAHRGGWPRAWHTDAAGHSNPLSVRQLRTDFVEAAGYTNMRCNLAPGCLAERWLDDPPTGSDKPNMPAALMEIFGWKQHELPAAIAAPCCSQFAVSRAQVHRRPKADYERFYNWLINTKLDDATSGRIFEYTWHIIFGKPAIWCPELMKCYCDVYGKNCR